MITCSPQRYLANNRNAVRTAALTPSSVQSVSDMVQEIPLARDGKAQVALTGSYDGAEEAVYDVQIVDDDVATTLISTPILAGVGSGTLDDVSSLLPAQQFTVELADNGIPVTAAGVDFDGVRLKARTTGAIGNAIRITIDQTPLIFTPTDFSLLADLAAGAGSVGAGLDGPAFDWDSKVLGADKLIPADAHRIAFADSSSDVYLQYKQYVNSKWQYFIVPDLRRDVPAGTPILFVTGGRTVEVSDGVNPPENFPDIVTLYDFLNALKTGSALVDVDGIVGNDRSPTGQASQELATRTDAHAEPSSGSGGVATGFTGVSVAPDAPTELITATCFAITNQDYPTAQLGSEAWKLKGSLSGDLGVVLTGQPFTAPDGEFTLTIPQRLPDGFGAPKGRFEVSDIVYVSRPAGVTPPDICVVAKLLGPAAVDMGIKLKYTKRPSGECLCNDLTVPDLAGPCIGTIDGETEGPVSYSPEAQTRIQALYDFAYQVANAVTKAVPGYAFDNIPDANTIVVSNSTLTTSATHAAGGVSVALTSSAVDPSGTTFDYPNDTDPVVTGFFDVGLPDDFNAVLDDFETALVAIDAILDTTLRAGGFAIWDDALTIFQADIDVAGNLVSTLGSRLETVATEKYALLMRRAQVYAGISTLGKTKASSEDQSGDGCWQDLGDPFYWVVTGSDGRVFGAAFNNKPFYSSVACGVANSADGHILGKFYATHEFAFQINIACPERLLVNDEIDLSIGNSSYGSTYQVKDTLTLPIIAAQPLFLAGGQDGTSVQIWYVSGSVAGPLGNFTYDPGAPTPYSTGGSPPDLSFVLTPGGIPFAQGDRFTFSTEGGHWQWRKNGGAWSSPADIPDGLVALDAGLSIQFTPGEAPSFVGGDTFSFRAMQPWAVSNLQEPTPARWQWTGDAPTLDIDFGSPQAIDMAAISLHTLPAGTTLTLQGGSTPSVADWTEPVTWRAGVIAQLLSQERTSRYVRLTLANVTGGGIGWLWLGQAFTTTLSADVSLTPSYRIDREAAGLFQGGAFMGKTVSGTVDWTEGSMEEADAAGIAALLDWVKQHDDEPFVFLPQVTRPDSAFLVRVALDDVAFDEISDYNRNVAFERRFSVSLPLSGVLQ